MNQNHFLGVSDGGNGIVWRYDTGLGRKTDRLGVLVGKEKHLMKQGCRG